MEVGVPASERMQLPSVSPADMEKAVAAASKYGLKIIPPSGVSSAG